MNHPPSANPDVQRELHRQLVLLSPRAFELFAGDLLVYVGLENVAVTRYIGDAGIDAEGDLVAGAFRFPVGVQVKRYRKNVQRADIDRFIGALTGRFAQGIFVTTADFSAGAQQKAVSTLPRVLTMSGTQVVATMMTHRLGLAPLPGTRHEWAIDAAYFAAFEHQTTRLTQRFAESGADYDVTSDEQPVAVPPEADLISLRALSYALRVDTTTIRGWLDSGKLQADEHTTTGESTGFFFRRDRIDAIRQQFALEHTPETSDAWRQEFLDFAQSRHLSKSYKPVLLHALLRLVDREGKVAMADLIQAFRAFYVQRQQDGLPVEFGGPLMTNPAALSDSAIKRLIVKYPLDRFLIKHYLIYDSDTDTIQIAPQLWQNLRYYDVLDVLQSAASQIDYYYRRHDEAAQ
jgi:hypothetical protein